MMTANELDTLNEVLDTTRERRALQALEVVASHVNVRSKKRLNNIREEMQYEDMQYYMACMECWKTLPLNWHLLFNRVRTHFEEEGKKKVIYNLQDFFDFEKEEESINIGCCLATLGFNVRVWPVAQFITISKEELPKNQTDTELSLELDESVFIKKATKVVPKPILERSIWRKKAKIVETKPYKGCWSSRCEIEQETA